jgi:glycosyltransferase involved in cell wall biosynthesis
MLEVSVIICSHNPNLNYLRRTLDALRAQTLSKHCWELILVDNASKPALASLLDISWHPSARHIVETELGLAPARRRGINEASADLLVFVDDDNLLDPSYLSEALAISREWVQLGTFGSGAIIPEFERQPADYLKKFLHLLALRQNDRDVWSKVISSPTVTPWGAGLCVRKEVARAYSEFSDRSSFSIIDRQGQSLVSGQDVEISYFACTLGLGMGIFTALRLTHLIPKERVEEGYLLRMVEGQDLSCALLAYKWLGAIPQSPLSLRGFLTFAKTVLLRGKIDRRVYFANLRATLKARRMIYAERKKSQKDSRKSGGTELVPSVAPKFRSTESREHI